MLLGSWCGVHNTCRRWVLGSKLIKPTGLHPYKFMGELLPDDPSLFTGNCDPSLRQNTPKGWINNAADHQAYAEAFGVAVLDSTIHGAGKGLFLTESRGPGLQRLGPYFGTFSNKQSGNRSVLLRQENASTLDYWFMIGHKDNPFTFINDLTVSAVCLCLSFLI